MKTFGGGFEEYFDFMLRLAYPIYKVIDVRDIGIRFLLL